MPEAATTAPAGRSLPTDLEKQGMPRLLPGDLGWHRLQIHSPF